MKKINKINESNVYDNFLNLPPVESLGDGVYEGAIVGHCFSHNGNKYFFFFFILYLYSFFIYFVL